jgi:hypothetical protein
VRNRCYKNKIKQNKKMAGITTYLSIITLNVMVSILQSKHTD